MGAHARARAGALRGALRRVRRRRAAALAERGPAHVADLRIFNPDGSEAELSGNGAREAILYLRRRGWTDRDSFAILTAAGPIRPQVTGIDTCTVDMGRASLRSKDFPGGPEDGEGRRLLGRAYLAVSTRLDRQSPVRDRASETELTALDLPAIGPAIEGDAHFPTAPTSRGTRSSPTPDGRAGGPGRIRARIFERGVGETLSSGTGASGAAIAHSLEYQPPLRPSSVTVLLDGGELEVEVGEDLNVKLTGWARPVFTGELSEDFEKELHETE